MNAPIAKEQIALLMSDKLTYQAAPVQGTGAQGRPTLSGRLAAALRYVAEFPRRQAVLDELSSLSDRELADIGLHRGELTQVFARAR